ncbi:TPA: hypothetical protein ACIAVG_004726 [Salmonella enterica subsp. enterica serovar Java]
MMQRKALGTVQTECLCGLVEHYGWYPGCGWTWGATSYTKKVMDSLVKGGYADNDNGKYSASYKGYEYVKYVRPYLFDSVDSNIMRKRTAKEIAEKLSEAKELLSRIVDSYGDEKASAAHPKQGALMAIEKINGLVKAMSQIK